VGQSEMRRCNDLERMLAGFGLGMCESRAEHFGLALTGVGNFRIDLTAGLVIAATIPDGIVLRLGVPDQV